MSRREVSVPSLHLPVHGVHGRHRDTLTMTACSGLYALGLVIVKSLLFSFQAPSRDSAHSIPPAPRFLFWPQGPELAPVNSHLDSVSLEFIKQSSWQESSLQDSKREFVYIVADIVEVFLEPKLNANVCSISCGSIGKNVDNFLLVCGQHWQLSMMYHLVHNINIASILQMLCSL